MKQHAQLGLSAIAAAFVFGAFQSVAHACPMCFSGNGINQNAFFWGSIFMMVVPVTTLGTLVYLAWRRIMTVDEHNAAGLAPRTPIVLPSSSDAPDLVSGLAIAASDPTSQL